MKKYIPNALTTIHLIIGTYGIFYVLTIDRGFAAYFVWVAACFDFLDGFTARYLHAKSKIGKQLDSLTDMVSFGLLPSLFMLTWMQETSIWFWTALLIPVFSAFRLAIFHTDESQSKSFKGLPTPANAILLTSLEFIHFPWKDSWLAGIILCSSLLLVSNIRLLALKFDHFNWVENEWRWIFLTGCLMLLIAFQWTFIPMLIPYYIIISLMAYVKIKKG